MRNTLIIGLLLCLPPAVLLASASLVVLAGHLCRRYSRSAGAEISVTQPVLVGQILAVFAQAGPGGQGDELLGLRPVVVDWRHREDETRPGQGGPS